jgi:hypothetical protein
MTEDMNKEPLLQMDKEALDAQLEVMKKAAKLSETDKAIERSRNIGDLKAILQILTHFNEILEKLHALPKEIPAREVKEPEYVEIPLFEEVEPKKKNNEYIWMVLFILLGVAVFAIGKLNVISGFTYTPHLISLEIGTFYTITEIEVFSVCLILIGIIGKAIVSSNNTKKYNIALEEYEHAKNDHTQAVEEAKKTNDELNEKYLKEVNEAQAEADEKNKLTHLQSMSYQTTLKHLKAEYMKKYSRIIPSEKLDIPYIKELIKVIETQKAQTIRGAVMYLNDKETEEEKGE